MVVEPIRDKKNRIDEKILRNGPFGERNHLLLCLELILDFDLRSVEAKVSDVVDEKGKCGNTFPSTNKNWQIQKFPRKSRYSSNKEYLKAANPEDTAPDRPLFPPGRNWSYIQGACMGNPLWSCQGSRGCRPNRDTYFAKNLWISRPKGRCRDRSDPDNFKSLKPCCDHAVYRHHPG